MRDRLMAQPPRDQRGEAGRGGVGHMAQQQVRTADAQRMGHQHFGIEPRGVAGGEGWRHRAGLAMVIAAGSTVSWRARRSTDGWIEHHSFPSAASRLA